MSTRKFLCKTSFACNRLTSRNLFHYYASIEAQFLQRKETTLFLQHFSRTLFRCSSQRPLRRFSSSLIFQCCERMRNEVFVGDIEMRRLKIMTKTESREHLLKTESIPIFRFSNISPIPRYQRQPINSTLR